MTIHIQYNENEPHATASAFVWYSDEDATALVGLVEMTSAGWALRLITDDAGQVDRDHQAVVVVTDTRTDAVLAALCCEGRIFSALLH